MSTTATRLVKYVLIFVFSVQVTGCGFFQKKPVESNPLISTECPAELPPLKDDTFGATTMKLSEVAGIYHACRAAATGAK